MRWKIVRDDDERACRDRGISGQWRVSATPLPGLTRKLFEEAAEFVESGDAGELYDLRDVLSALIGLADPDGEAWIQHASKVQKRGEFHRHIEWTPEPA